LPVAIFEAKSFGVGTFSPPSSATCSSTAKAGSTASTPRPVQQQRPRQLPPDQPQLLCHPAAAHPRRPRTRRPRPHLLLPLLLSLRLPVLPISSTPRHLDRSDRQSHRLSRSGETPVFRLCPCCSPPQSKNRHFDRSNSQPHRELRSGETRCSTQTLPESTNRRHRDNSRSLSYAHFCTKRRRPNDISNLRFDIEANRA
jgi:hypothetical protein